MKLTKELKFKFITLLACISLLAIHYLIINPWMLDDAFISFRYARNFAEGKGLTFNPGEPVEGYTNFLWTVILGGLNWIGFDIVSTSIVLGYAFSIGTLVLILFYWKTKDFRINLIASLILASFGAFSVWGASGMETSLFTFLMTTFVLTTMKFLKKPERSAIISMSILTVLISLTRPEGYLVFGYTLAALVAIKYILKRKFSLKILLLYPAVFLSLISFHFIFRYIYYNDYIPNTFYNKVGSGIDQYLRGMRYVKSFLEASWHLFAVLIIYLVINIKKFKEKGWTRNLYLFGLIGAFTAYIIYVGGDVMPGFRFFTAVTPAIAILAGTSLVKLANRLNKEKLIMILGITILIAINLSQWYFHEKLNEHLINDNVAYYGKEVGLFLKENFPKDTRLGANTAGTLPYYSELYTIDMLGLNNKHIAKREMPNMGKGYPGHEKTDARYILDQKPDIIQFASSLGSKEPILVSDRELVELEEFHENYHYEEFELDSDRILGLYIRNDFQY